MKFCKSAVCLALMSVSALGHATGDTRSMYNNESSVHYLAAAENSDATVADVVVFYQPTYMAKYGEYEGHKRIDAMVALANESYQAHGLNYRLSVKDVLPVESVPDDAPYQDVVDENGTVIQDGADYLFSLAALNSGSPEYSAYQERLKADLVVYIREKRDGDTVLGLGGIGGEYSSIVDDGSDPEQNTALAHEVGHNIGMNHEDANAFVGPDYARAWICGGMKTIMYSTTSHGDTLHHYSTPDLSFDGEVCGNDATANNAKVLEDNFPKVAARREGVAVEGIVSFANSVFSGNEQDGVVITLTRNGDLSQEASVKVFAENGTATWGEDFVDAYVTASFAAGADTTTVTYPMVNDGVSEGVEDFTLQLKYPYKLEADSATAQAKIQDGNQTGYAGVFSISGETSINEGDSGEFVISRSGGIGEVVVNVQAVAGSAVSGSDFVELNQNVLFADGQSTATVLLKTIDDNAYKDDKSLKLRITAANDTAEYENQELAVNIIENDAPPAEQGSFALGVSSDSVSESSGSVSVSVSRQDGADGQVTMRVYTQDGSAKAGTDYQALDQSIVFEDGETTKTVAIGLINNSIVDGPRDFSVNLTGEAEVTTGSVTVTITNDDVESGNSNTGNGNSSADSGSSSGGSMGILSVLLLGVIGLFRTPKYANKKPI